ncbi:type II secretion system F family protein [Thermomonospora catenispora]|uniref:type II secretion system F family protein n=1 Tax=Thermomonospora catenispora TaxID=2493090 RepID=UPI001F5028A9|nr:type II secretion system F family protein [Thermomonospora catenispora]
MSGTVFITVLAVGCAAGAGFALPRGGSVAARRLESAMRDRGGAVRAFAADTAPASPAAPPRRDIARRATPLAAGLIAWPVFGGLGGLCAGIATAAAVAVVLGRAETRGRRERARRLAADVPVAADLLAACLRGGVSWPEAAEAVAEALGGPLGAELCGITAKVRLGADPAEAWLALTAEPSLASLGRAVARAVDSGAPLAPALTKIAEDRRRRAHAEAMARARAVGVYAIAPLGLCFLPAFVLLGIVPAIAGIARSLLVPL